MNIFNEVTNIDKKTVFTVIISKKKMMRTKWKIGWPRHRVDMFKLILGKMIAL